MKLLTVIFCLLFSFAVRFSRAQTAQAQSSTQRSSYSEGVISYDWLVDAKSNRLIPFGRLYFSPDSSAYCITTDYHSHSDETLEIRDTKGQFYFYKQAAVMGIRASPSEIKEFIDSAPKFSYKQTNEIQQISGFNCKKVIATDMGAHQNYDVWVTFDINVPKTAIPLYYSGIRGLPVRYTVNNNGYSQTFIISRITSEKAPAGTYSIPPNYVQVTIEQANSYGAKVWQYFR